MAKREFVQLAHTLNPAKHMIAGRMMSEKLDGMRCIWDGGASRGIPASDVPWANTEKDARFVEAPISTGLWSRYGNVIHAPAWFLDTLPSGVMLDGELWCGPGQFQRVVSITRSLDSSDWNEVTFKVLDMIDPSIIFQYGIIDNTNFHKVIVNCIEWWKEHTPTKPIHVPRSFSTRYNLLFKVLADNDSLELHVQRHLPLSTPQAQRALDLFLEKILDRGGEGIILRNPATLWVPERTQDVLKYKPWLDAEGTVVGYTWGRETDKGSKLLGKMGALILVSDTGKEFKLSGFTDAERKFDSIRDGVNIAAIGGVHQGETMIHEGIYNPQFPRGSRVTFKYRELTEDGVPKEARYWRKT